MSRGIEFIRSREPKGSFGAGVEALTGIAQDDVHRALARSGLYHSGMGLQLVPAAELNNSMRNGSVPVSFSEELPFFNGYEGDENAMDASPAAAEERLEIIQEEISMRDHQGTILFHPRRRGENGSSSGDFVAVVEPQISDAALTVMDPSGLPGYGGVFQRTEEEALKMLTPCEDKKIPVFSYSLRMIPAPQSIGTVEAEIALEVPVEETERVLALA